MGDSGRWLGFFFVSGWKGSRCWLEDTRSED